MGNPAAGRGEDVDPGGFHRRPGQVGMRALGDLPPFLPGHRTCLAQPTRPAHEGERLVIARQKHLAFQASSDVSHRLPVVAVQQDRRLVLVEHLAGGLGRRRVWRAGKALAILRTAVLAPQPHPGGGENLPRRRNHDRVQGASSRASSQKVWTDGCVGASIGSGSFFIIRPPFVSREAGAHRTGKSSYTQAAGKGIHSAEKSVLTVWA